MSVQTINHVHDALLEAQALFEVIQACAISEQELPINIGLVAQAGISLMAIALTEVRQNLPRGTA